MKLLSFALGVMLQLAMSAGAAEEGFEPLFDGRSLDGWEGNLKIFRVEDGAIVGGTLSERIARNEFLCTTRDYGDFELRLKFKVLGKGANAGVQFRSRRIPNHHEVKGYQADLGDGWWGSLYDESRRNKILAAADAAAVNKVLKRDDWNDYTIRCQGPQNPALDQRASRRSTTRSPTQAIEQNGLIGLQIHGGPPSEAWYKDIRIKKL